MLSCWLVCLLSASELPPHSEQLSLALKCWSLAIPAHCIANFPKQTMLEKKRFTIYTILRIVGFLNL